MNNILIKHLKHINQNTKLTNNQKLTKIAQIVDNTHDDLLRNKLYNLILTKNINTKVYTLTDFNTRSNAIDYPKKSQQDEKICNYLYSNKSAKLGKFTYLNNPTKLIASKDLTDILDALLSNIENYHNQVANSKIYDIYIANSDKTLTNTTYKVITNNLIKQIENQFMHYEHIFLVPSGYDNHAHSEYHWVKDLFDVGININSKNDKAYIKKIEPILSDMSDTIGEDYIDICKKELLKPELTIKRKKDLIFSSALAFTEYILYEKY